MGRPRIIIEKKRLRGRPQLKGIINQPKGLEGLPGSGMKLGQSNIKDPKEPHGKLVER